MKILHILSMLPVGGVGGYLKNICDFISEKYNMEFLVTSEIKDGPFIDYINKKGGKIFFLPSVSLKNIVKLKKEIKKFFINNKYDVVELHSMNMSFLFLRTIKKHTVAKTIVHGHSTKYSNTDSLVRNVRNYILSQPMMKWADYYIACGEKVSYKMFIKRGVKRERIFVMPNPINAMKKLTLNQDFIKSFKTNDADRICLAVGNLVPAKNYGFLLKVFKIVEDRDPNVKLLIAGEGELRVSIEREIAALQIKNVRLLGFRSDIEKLLNMANLVVMPSLFEGLPVVALEAQSLGLPLLLSDKITSEIKINSNVEYLSIKDNDVLSWAVSILKWINKNEVIDNKFFESKFNINKSINDLEKFYDNVLIGEEK